MKHQEPAPCTHQGTHRPDACDLTKPETGDIHVVQRGFNMESLFKLPYANNVSILFAHITHG